MQALVKPSRQWFAANTMNLSKLRGNRVRAFRNKADLRNFVEESRSLAGGEMVKLFGCKE